MAKLVSEHLAMPLKEVKKNIDVPFRDYRDINGNPICDELDYIELLLAFEEEFDIEIHEKEEETLTSIRDIVDFIINYEVREVDEDETDSELLKKRMKKNIYDIWVKTYGKADADRMVAEGILDDPNI